MRRVGGLALTALLVASSPATERSAMVARIREEIVEAAPKAKGPELERALAALGAVPRERFVASGDRHRAYAERSLAIGAGQTISDPYIVAVMTMAARLPGGANVLDVGTGSGYQAAVLSRLADRVAGVEIVPELASAAKARLARLGFANVAVRAGDGFAGWPERAPFDAILVAAGAAQAPQPLLDQLKVGGRLVMPIGPSWNAEQLLVLTKVDATTVTRCSLGWAMFVPLTGRGERSRAARGVLDRHIPLCFGTAVARVDMVADG